MIIEDKGDVMDNKPKIALFQYQSTAISVI
jgi:hypothetical protein